MLQSRGASEQLKNKLLQLKLKKLSQYLLYDPEDIFGKRLRSQPNPLGFRAESRPELLSWRNPDQESKVIPTALITKDLLPPWFAFYTKKANFDPRTDSISKKSLKTLRDQGWSEEKIAAFTQYRVESRNRNTPLESDLDDKFEELWEVEHPADASADEGSEGSEGKGEQGRARSQTSAQEEQPSREVGEVSTGAAAKRPGRVYSTKRKNQKEKTSLPPPPKRRRRSPTPSGTLSVPSSPISSASS